MSQDSTRNGSVVPAETAAPGLTGGDIIETLRTCSIYFTWAGEAATEIETLRERLRVSTNANKLAVSEIERLVAIVSAKEVKPCC